MNESSSAADTGSSEPSRPMAPPSKSQRQGIAGIACSALGGLAWVGLIPLLSPYDQSEQLARYFAALFNVIILAAIGGAGILLLLVGLMLSRKATRDGNVKQGRVGLVVAWAGLFAAMLILLWELPSALKLLG